MPSTSHMHQHTPKYAVSNVGGLHQFMVVLAKMADGTAQSSLDGFSEAISAILAELRKTFTYDQRARDD